MTRLLLALALSFAPAPPAPSWRVDLDPRWRDRFPPREFARGASALAGRRLHWLDRRIAFYGPYGAGAECWAYWREDQLRRLTAWDTLAMDDRDGLRAALGESAWRAGRMPAPVPLCRWGLEEQEE